MSWNRIVRNHYDEFERFMSYFLRCSKSEKLTDDSFDTDGDARLSFKEFTEF